MDQEYSEAIEQIEVACYNTVAEALCKRDFNLNWIYRQQQSGCYSIIIMLLYTSRYIYFVFHFIG